MIENIKCADLQGQVNKGLSKKDLSAMDPGMNFEQLLNLLREVNSEGFNTVPSSGPGPVVGGSHLTFAGKDTAVENTDQINMSMFKKPLSGDAVSLNLLTQTETAGEETIKDDFSQIASLTVKSAANQLAEVQANVMQTGNNTRWYIAQDSDQRPAINLKESCQIVYDLPAKVPSLGENFLVTQNPITFAGKDTAVKNTSQTVVSVFNKPLPGDAAPFCLSNDGFSTKSSIDPSQDYLITEPNLADGVVANKQLRLPTGVTVDPGVKTNAVQTNDTIGRYIAQEAVQQSAVESRQTVKDLLAKVPPLGESSLLTVKLPQNLAEKVGETGITTAGPSLTQTHSTFTEENVSVENKSQIAMPVFTAPETGINKQQFETSQVAMNLTNFTAKVDSTTTGEAIPASRPGENTVIIQLAEAVRGHIVKNGDGQTMVRLQLQPEHLGELNIRMTYRDGNISTQIQTATENVKHMIENSLPQLRDTLASFQLNLQNVSVSVGGENGHRGQEWDRERRFKKQQGPKISGSGTNSVDTVPGVGAKIPLSSSMNRLNYFV